MQPNLPSKQASKFYFVLVILPSSENIQIFRWIIPVNIAAETTNTGVVVLSVRFSAELEYYIWQNGGTPTPPVVVDPK